MYILLYVYECFMCTEYILSAWGGQNGALDFLEIELQMIVGHHVCGGVVGE